MRHRINGFNHVCHITLIAFLKLYKLFASNRTHFKTRLLLQYKRARLRLMLI
uniref:Uncharacterized protein n=1 Tax=uncultured marine virus TaxID=186617 RepID=A0A0F7L424_9VIRU|nr:hypothetical protein [uncultured marine virus]